MQFETLVLITGAAGLGGLVVGYFLRWLVSLGKKGSMEITIKQILLDAKAEAQRIVEEAERKATDRLEEIKQEEREKSTELKRTEERLIKKDELLDKRQIDIDAQTETLKSKAEDIKQTEENTASLKAQAHKELEKISNLSEKEAREELFRRTERAHEEDMTVRLQKLEREGAEKMDRRGKEILTAVIQRLASSTASSVMSTSVEIPSEDIKGKIIGKEGRNIRAFERASGVELIVDEIGRAHV